MTNEEMIIILEKLAVQLRSQQHLTKTLEKLGLVLTNMENACKDFIKERENEEINSINDNSSDK